MSPITISAILTLVEQLFRDVPSAVIEVKKLLEKPNPTPADWIELRERITVPYETRVPHTKLPK